MRSIRGDSTDASRYVRRSSPIRHGFARSAAGPHTAVAPRSPRRLRAPGHRRVRARRLAGRQRDGTPRDRDHAGSGRPAPRPLARAVGPGADGTGVADAGRRGDRRGDPVPRGAAPGSRPRRRHRPAAARPEADVHPGGRRRYGAPFGNGDGGVLRTACRSLPATRTDDVRPRVPVGGQQSRPGGRRRGPAQCVARRRRRRRLDAPGRPLHAREHLPRQKRTGGRRAFREGLRGRRVGAPGGRLERTGGIDLRRASGQG